MLDNVQIATMEAALEDLFEIARDSGINILEDLALIVGVTIEVVPFAVNGDKLLLSPSKSKFPI